MYQIISHPGLQKLHITKFNNKSINLPRAQTNTEIQSFSDFPSDNVRA